MPCVTIVTINYNNSFGLEKTIESVRKQNYQSIEYIIIDGGSSDGSRLLIENNKAIISDWISEKDDGIYHAMNKGIERANGKYLLFLNSGDFFNDSECVQRLVFGSQNEDIIYGDILMCNLEKTWLKSHPDKLSFEYFLKDTLPHPASLIKKSLFSKVGYYSEHYKIVSDWEFFMNAICRYGATYKHNAFPVTVFHQDGISSTPGNFDLINKERQDVLTKYYSAFLPDYVKLDQCRTELYNALNSRLHKLVDKFLKSSIYRFIKGR